MNVDNFLAFENLRNKLTRSRILIVLLVLALMFQILGMRFFPKRSGNKNKDYVAKVKIDSDITDSLFDLKSLNKLRDDNIKAVILEIDSPGGEVVPSEILFNFFKTLSKKKPVVTSIKGLAASGAYMVALSSDFIVAYNTSLVGSIGVLIQNIDVQELIQKIGIKIDLVKSSPLKATPNPYETMDEDTHMVLKEQINDIYSYFLDLFIRERKIKPSEARDIANGQVYTGKQALEYHLIDKIGGLDEVKEYLSKVKKLDMERLEIIDVSISKEYPRSFLLRHFINKIFTKNKPLLRNLDIITH